MSNMQLGIESVNYDGNQPQAISRSDPMKGRKK